MMSMTRLHTTLILVALVSALAGCASPADKQAMSVGKGTVVAKKHPYTVGVTVRGGAETTAGSSSNIADADLKAAIESSIRETQVFRDIVQGKNGQYELVVNVVQLTKPTFGFSFTVDMEAGWTLTRLADGQVVYRKAITSSYTATTSAAFAGVTRLRLAVEGAAKANIAQGLAAVGELSL
jgi:hypothetical protein